MDINQLLSLYQSTRITNNYGDSAVNAALIALGKLPIYTVDENIRSDTYHGEFIKFVYWLVDRPIDCSFTEQSHTNWVLMRCLVNGDFDMAVEYAGIRQQASGHISDYKGDISSGYHAFNTMLISLIPSSQRRIQFGSSFKIHL